MRTDCAIGTPVRANPSRLRVHLAFPQLPPVLNGIADYTALLAQGLANHCEVKVLAGPGDFDPIDGVTIEQAFDFGRFSGISEWVEAVVVDQPDWLVLQYNPFSYGRWGFCPALPLALAYLKRRTRTRVALMVHEPFVPATTLSWAVATTWQRSQLFALGRSADQVFFSIEPWSKRFGRWFPGKPVEHLPVGSSFPHAGVPRSIARERLKIDPDCVVVGLFGGAHPSRQLDFVHAAIARLSTQGVRFELIYIGPHGGKVKHALAGSAFRDLGALAPELVSQHFSAMDVYLTPFIDGASTRRTSLMVGLQHGVATVTTHGTNTDGVLLARNGEALLLGPANERERFVEHALDLVRSPERRKRISEGGQRLFEEQFAWPRIVDRLVQALRR